MKNKIISKLHTRLYKTKKILLVSFILLTTYLTLFFILLVFLNDRIMPNVILGNINLGGMKKSQAEELLLQKSSYPDYLEISIDEQKYKVNLSDIELMYNNKKSIDNAYNTERSGIFIMLHLFNDKIYVDPSFTLNDQKLESEIDKIVNAINVEPVYPHLYIKNGNLLLEKGSSGKTVDKITLISLIKDNLSKYIYSPIVTNTKTIDTTLSDKESSDFILRGKQLVGKKITVKLDSNTLTYSDEFLVKTLNPKGGLYDNEINSLVTDVSSSINRDARDSVFIFVPSETGDNSLTSGKVKEFIPSQEGIKVNNDLLKTKIAETIGFYENGGNNTTIDIPVEKTQPNISTESINNLGIRQLIGRGDSKFAGSIASRIHNVSLASSKFNGVLVAPGETFSFNKTLGDVSAYTGYKQAYIIRDGQTVLGDGGGVCQVSTTLFRAVLNAGLPIVERRAHSYRVAYYEQGSPPGLDATVFDPTTDFKFKNDTSKYILIQTRVDTAAKTLSFELYGTNDGRISSISKPQITEVTPPPDDLYIDDPTLPAGQIKQIDYKAWGARVNFKYTVEKNGNVIYEKTFYSNYQPWQAKFLKGTGV